MKKILENKVFKIIYGIIRGFIVGLLFIYLVFVVMQRLTNNSSIFGYRVFTVATGSMEPVYNVNDVILVKDEEAKNLKVGDDAAYKDKSGIIITHRIVRIEKNDVGDIRYYFKGVNNEYEDQSVSGSQIYGKVVGKVYIINFINHIVKNMYGFFFLVFCPLVLVIFLEIADTIIDIKVEKNEIRLIGSDEKEDIDDTNKHNENAVKLEGVKLSNSIEGDNDEEII